MPRTENYMEEPDYAKNKKIHVLVKQGKLCPTDTNTIIKKVVVVARSNCLNPLGHTVGLFNQVGQATPISHVRSTLTHIILFSIDHKTVAIIL